MIREEISERRDAIRRFRTDEEDGIIEIINTILNQRALPTQPQPLLRQLL